MSNKCTESLLNQQFLFFNRIFLPAKWCDFNQKTAHSTTRSNVKWKNVEIRGQNVYGGVQWKIESFVSIRSNAFNCRKLPWLNNTIATEWENHPKIAKTINCAGGTQQSIPFRYIQLSLHVHVLTRFRWMTNYKKHPIVTERSSSHRCSIILIVWPLKLKKKTIILHHKRKQFTPISPLL